MFDLTSGTSATSFPKRCPCCGQYVTNGYAVAYEPANTYEEIPKFEEFIISDEGLTPSCGYWPHHLHEKFVKKRVKPTDQFKIKPLINRKQFMQLKTFKNLRF